MTDQRPDGLVVAILTFRRPDDLGAILPEVAAQLGSVALPSRILVVDNDPAGSARSQVEALAATAPISYVHEPTPGIAAARNRALDEAAGDRWLIFIDDDERPSEGWLAALLATAVDTGSAGVAGPVISRFASTPEPWIVAGGFFDRRRVPTGTRVELVATNNLIIDLEQLREIGVRFDNRFGLTGGSDTLFSLQLGQHGRTLTWCDEAIVYDIVPEARSTRTWVLRRARRTGNSWVRTSLATTTSPVRRSQIRAKFFTLGLVRIAAGGLRTAAGTVTSRIAHQARGRRTAARGLGLVTGAVGIAVTEYRRS